MSHIGENQPSVATDLNSSQTGVHGAIINSAQASQDKVLSE